MKKTKKLKIVLHKIYYSIWINITDDERSLVFSLKRLDQFYSFN